MPADAPYTPEPVPRIDIDAPAAPPRWALLQRLLIDQLNEAATEFVNRYTRHNKTLIWRTDWPGMDGSDDPYEAFQNLALLYVLGGEQHALMLAEQMWEAITWQWTQYGQIYDEFDGYYDWMHHGESSLLLYFLGLAHPGAQKWKQRAAKFADLYAAPGAANYDPEQRIIRSPINGSRGPRFEVTAEDWVTHRPILKRSPFEDIPGITLDTPHPWVDDDVFAQILERMNERMTRSDIPWNLNATGLVSHGYMFTANETYRQWVLDYVAAWADRVKDNGGIVPDNIGPTGLIGEQNNGNWWGGYYGWRWKSLNHILQVVTNGAVNATLLSGDLHWLAMPRRQIDVSWELRQRGDNGEWRVPLKHTDNGWTDYRIQSAVELVHLWHASMADEDADRLDRLDHPAKWREIYIPNCTGMDEKLGRGTKHLIANTLAWYDYIRGSRAGYPEAILEANLEGVARQLARLRSPEGDPRQWDLDDPFSIHMWQRMCPLILEGLAQLTLGAPMHISHGGLQHAAFRYFDANRQRPGLPASCAALVTDLSADEATVELVNVSSTSPCDVIIQAGSFGEHTITSVTATTSGGQPITTAKLDGPQVHVHLQQRAAVRLKIGTRRYSRTPSYNTPWASTAAVPLIRGRDRQYA